MADTGAAQQKEDPMFDVVQVTLEHIRSNGTLHTSPCNGLSELIDNSVDSQAKNVYITNNVKDRRESDGTVKKIRYITVNDDGIGMNREEALKTILVGYSLKRGDVGLIGQFGNGLKSGSMRVGETMLLGTLKDREYTVLMISLPFLESVEGNKCLVPCISYKVDSNDKLHPMKYANEPKEKHAAALEVILKWSPFANEEALFEHLQHELPCGSIEEKKSGTAVALSDLKKMENNEYELQWNNRQSDFVVKKREEDGRTSEVSREKLSVFLENLYLEPKIAIFLGRKQVRLVDPLRSFASPRWTLLSETGMASFVAREKENVQKELERKESQKLPIQQRLARLQAELSVNPTNKELRQEQRRKTTALEECETQCQHISKRLASISRQRKPGSDIRVYFGLDLEHRSEPRAVFYSSGRRVLVHPLKAKGEQKFKTVMGVVCTVNIPSTLLPTKQHRESFETHSEFLVIAKKIDQHARIYFEHVERQYKDPAFWQELGYDDRGIFYQFSVPDMTKNGVEQRMFELMGEGRRQCNGCREFRPVTWQQYNEDKDRIHNILRCRPPGDDEGCSAKTPAQKLAEQIKELDTSGKATFFQDKTAPPKPSISSQKKRTRSVSTSSERSLAPSRENGSTPSLPSQPPSPVRTRKNSFVRNAVAKGRSSKTSSTNRSRSSSRRGAHISSDEEDGDEVVRISSDEEYQEPSVVSRRSTRSAASSARSGPVNRFRSSCSPVSPKKRVSHGGLGVRKQLRMAKLTPTWKHPYSDVENEKDDEEKESEDEENDDAEDEEEEQEVNVEGDEDREEEEEDDEVEEEDYTTGDDDVGNNDLPSSRDWSMQCDANDGQESVASHSTYSTLIGRRSQPSEELEKQRKGSESMMDSEDQRSTAGSSVSAVSKDTNSASAFGAARPVRGGMMTERVALRMEWEMKEAREKRKMEENSAVENKKPRTSMEEYKIPKRSSSGAPGEGREGEEGGDDGPSTRNRPSGGRRMDDPTILSIYEGTYQEHESDGGDDVIVVEHANRVSVTPSQSNAAVDEGVQSQANEELKTELIALQLKMKDDEMKKKNEEMKRKEEELAAERAETALLREQMEKKEEEMKKKEEELGKKGGEMKEKDEAMKKMEEELATERAERNVETTMLREEVSKRVGELVRKEEEMVKKEEELMDVKDELEEKEEELKKMKAEMAGRNEEKEKRTRTEEDTERSQRNLEIAILHTQLEMKDEEMKAKEELMKKKEKELKEIMEEIEKKDEEVKKMKAEMADCEMNEVKENDAETNKNLREFARLMDVPTEICKVVDTLRKMRDSETPIAVLNEYMAGVDK